MQQASSFVSRRVRPFRPKDSSIWQVQRRVLVGEDEILLRMAIVDCLENAGFVVLEAGDADEAIDILQSKPDIRLLFTDVDMPGSMDGLKLAAAVRDRWPPIEIVVTSGQVSLRSDQLPRGGQFFPKSYNGSNVVRAVQEMIVRWRVDQGFGFRPRGLVHSQLQPSKTPHL